MKKKVKKMVDGVETEVEEEVLDVGEDSKQNAAPAGLFAKKMLIKQSGIYDSGDVDRINSIEDADILLKEIEKKNAKPSIPEKKGAIGNLKVLPKDNPDPRKQVQLQNKTPEAYSPEELFDPLQTASSRLNKFQDDENVRIVRRYDERSPAGRII